MKNSILSVFTLFLISSLYAQKKVVKEEVKCHLVESSNGKIIPNLNRSIGWNDIGEFPYLNQYLTTFKEKNFDRNGNVIFEKNEEFEYSCVYNEDGSLIMKVSEQIGQTDSRDTTFYNYNDFDSVEFTYQLPLLETDILYYDENNRIIPYYKYDYLNKNHSQKVVSRIMVEEYDYDLETKKNRGKHKGVFELEKPNTIGQMIQPLSEESFTYYSNGKLKSRSYSDPNGSIKEEWTEDGSKRISIMYLKGDLPQFVSIEHYQGGKLKKIENMAFPYKNYPTGIKSENGIAEFEYDENQLLSKITYADLINSSKIVYDFKYKLNEVNDWIEKVVYVNNVPKFIELRRITYSDN